MSSKDNKIIADKKANSSSDTLNYFIIGTGVVTISVFSYYLYKQNTIEEEITKLKSYDERITTLTKKIENVEKLLRINGTDSLMINKILLELSKFDNKVSDKETEITEYVNSINTDLDKIVKDLNDVNKDYNLIRHSKKKRNIKKSKKSKKSKYISDSESDSSSDEEEIKVKHKRYSKKNKHNKEEDDKLMDIFNRQ